MDYIFPNKKWKIAQLNNTQWSVEYLDKAKSIYQTFPSSSMMILDHGHLIAAWGELDKKIKISSVRKSILSTLFGILHEENPVDLNATLADLKIDDFPELTKSEKKATVQDILQSRSGIYHDYIGGSPRMRVDLPERNSFLPGTHWYYNNWDFNCAGFIFEKLFGITIPEAFIKYLADPLTMEDFHLSDFYYYPSRQPKQGEAPSLFPAYHFRMTIRDMARLGCLYAAGGFWNRRQIIPKIWMQKMITPYSSAFSNMCPIRNSSYGYFWWVNSWPDVSEINYSAKGNLGKYIIIFPNKKISVICQIHTEAPDNTANETINSYSRFDNIPDIKMSELLNNILLSKLS